MPASKAVTASLVLFGVHPAVLGCRAGIEHLAEDGVLPLP
jgi:hypothetical protein